LFFSEVNIEKAGGIERHIRLLIKYLKKIDIDCFSINSEEFKRCSFFDKNIISESLLSKKILEIKPDIIHIHGFSNFSVYQALKTSINLGLKVFYTPAYHPFEFHRRPFLAKAFFHIFLKRKLLAKCFKITTFSEYEKLFFIYYINNSKIVVLPSGVEYVNGIEAKQKPKENNLIFVARPVHSKGFNLIQKLEKSLEEMKIKINVVGPNLNYVNSTVFKYYSNISDKELNSLYRNATATIIPSMYESFSIVGLESLSQGTPIIISDRVMLKEYFKDKDYVTEFNYTDGHDALLNCIKKAIGCNENHYLRISQESISDIKRFRWDNVVKEYYAEYLHCLTSG